MGVLIANDILMECSYALVDTPVSTTIAAGVSAGVQTVTPTSTRNIFIGALLIIGRGTAQEEVVTVTAIAATDFTATFAQTHAGSTGVVGAVFAAGQVDDTQSLFTQAEMLGYLSTGQNDFLLRLRPIYKRTTQSLAASTTVFAQPSDCIRLERLSIGGYEIPDSAQSYLDGVSPDWPGATAKASPDEWFQDKVDTGNFGIAPQLTAPATAALYYSEKVASAIVLNSTLLVPDIMCHYLKYYVLFKAFSKDGEQRDLDRAAFCYSRFTMGVKVSRKFLEGIGLGVNETGLTGVDGSGAVQDIPPARR